MTQLKGIDTSKWQAGLPDATIEADFIIFKATEGVGYVDPDCNPSYQEAKSAGKLLGVYHFARPDGNDPISEAEYFVNNIRGYIGEALLALDWETNPEGNVAWAKQWLDHVTALTGVRPLIYMSASVVNQYDWSSVSSDYALWVARYWDMATDVNYDMSNAGPLPDVNWPNGYAMWQWTSRGRLNGYAGDLDCNVFYGSSDSWHAFARVRATTPVVTPPVITPPVVTPVVTEPVTPPIETPVIPLVTNPETTPIVAQPVITQPVETITTPITVVPVPKTNLFALIWNAIKVLLRKIKLIK